MLKLVEKFFAIILGFVFLVKGLTFGLAVLLLIEFFTREKAVR